MAEVYLTSFDEFHATGVMPIMAFKHLRRADERFWRDGSILLRPLSYFRTVEDAAPGVKDPLEGVVRSTLNVDLAPYSDFEVRRRLARHNIIQAPNSTRIIMVRGEYVQHVENLYVLCLSTLPYGGLFGSDYDHVVGIRSCVQVARDIVSARPDVLSGAWSIGLVRYTKRVVELRDENPQLPSPYLKCPRFKHQRELRICFRPRGPIRSEVVVKTEVAPFYLTSMAPPNLPLQNSERT